MHTDLQMLQAFHAGQYDKGWGWSSALNRGLIKLGLSEVEEPERELAELERRGLMSVESPGHWRITSTGLSLMAGSGLASPSVAGLLGAYITARAPTMGTPKRVTISPADLAQFRKEVEAMREAPWPLVSASSAADLAMLAAVSFDEDSTLGRGHFLFDGVR